MTCQRCGGGPLIEAKCYDEEAVVWLWRCFTCGDYTDHMILAHRAFSTPPEPRPDNRLPVFDPTRPIFFERPTFRQLLKDLRRRIGAA